MNVMSPEETERRTVVVDDQVWMYRTADWPGRLPIPEDDGPDGLWALMGPVSEFGYVTKAKPKYAGGVWFPVGLADAMKADVEWWEKMKRAGAVKP